MREETGLLPCPERRCMAQWLGDSPGPHSWLVVPPVFSPAGQWSEDRLHQKCWKQRPNERTDGLSFPAPRTLVLVARWQSHPVLSHITVEKRKSPKMLESYSMGFIITSNTSPVMKQKQSLTRLLSTTTERRSDPGSVARPRRQRKASLMLGGLCFFS